MRRTAQGIPLSRTRLRLADLVFVAVLIIGMSLRVGRLDYFIADQDTARNHLMTNHLLRYGEFPLVGLGNNYFPDSPIYYVVLAPFLILRNDMVAFGVADLFFQIVSFISLYIISCLAFGRLAGLITGVLSVFSGELFPISYAYTPQVMQPFVLASYGLLLLTYRLRKPSLIPMSVILFGISIALYMSVWAAMPAYLAALWLVVRSLGKRLPAFAASCGLLLVTLLLLYGSVLWHFAIVKAPISRAVPKHSLIITNSTELVTHAHGIVRSFLDMTIRRNTRDIGPFTLNDLLVLLLVVALIRFWQSRQTASWQRVFVWLSGFVIITPVILLAPVRIDVFGRYFVHTLGLFYVVIGGILAYAYRNQKALMVFLVPVTALLVWVGAGDALGQQVHLKAPAMPTERLVYAGAEAIRQDLLTIQQRDKRPNVGFFRLKRLYVTAMAPWYNPNAPVETLTQDDMVFLVPMENVLHEKLVRIEPSNSVTFLTGDEYIYLICNEFGIPFEPPESECLPRFVSVNPEYRYEVPVFAKRPISIYRLRKAP